MASHKSGARKLVVSGEDVESEEENEVLHATTPAIAITDVDGRAKSGGVKVVTFGEAPESDVDDFGSTISLDSASNSLEMDLSPLKMDAEVAAVLAPILPQRRSPRLDPAVVRKHRDRNRSLRINISEKFLTPVVLQTGKRFERLSQNLSNSQMQMQEALFQSRIASGNLLKLQKELEAFLEEDYLKELKILPSDEESEGCYAPIDKSTGAVTDLDKENSSGSLLTAALSGGAHLI